MPVRINPVAVGACETFEIVLFDIVVLFPPKFSAMQVTEPDPVLILLNVLPVIVFVGPGGVVGPFTSLQPATVVPPVRVTLEKLFPVSVKTAPAGDVSPTPVLKKVTVPPA